MKLFFLIILLSCTYILSSQNLVRNGSMEKYFSCPNNLNQINNSIGWFGIDVTLKSGDGSCEYFNKCDSNNNVGVPKNNLGFAYSYNGNGYIGHGYYSKLGGQDEYSSTKLRKELVGNRLYVVSFYVQLNEWSSYAIKEISTYFSKDTIKWGQILADTINPQFINNHGIITDTAHWVRIMGTFYANGGERFMTLGNFYRFRPVHTQFLSYGIPEGYAYYYIDAVAVYPCDAPISTAKTINDTLICKGNTISPGLTQVEPQYKTEYEWFWYKSGSEEDTLSTEQFPVFQPDTTTSYVLKLTDFKYDITYDTVNVEVVDCKQPTSLKVYPNPTHDVVYFAFDSPIPKGLSIELYNLMGQKVKGISYKPNKESRLVDLNLKTLPTGIYFYRVLMEDAVHFSGKIIKI